MNVEVKSVDSWPILLFITLTKIAHEVTLENISYSCLKVTSCVILITISSCHLMYIHKVTSCAKLITNSSYHLVLTEIAHKVTLINKPTDQAYTPVIN